MVGGRGRQSRGVSGWTRTVSRAGMFTVHLSDLFAPTVQSSVLNLDHRDPSAGRRLATTPTTFSSRTTTSCRPLPPALTTGSPPPPSLHALSTTGSAASAVSPCPGRAEARSGHSGGVPAGVSATVTLSCLVRRPLCFASSPHPVVRISTFHRLFASSMPSSLRTNKKKRVVHEIDRIKLPRPPLFCRPASPTADGTHS